MNDTSLKISINTDIRRLLEDMNLYKSMGVKNIGEHSLAFKDISRTGNHIDMYKVAIREFDYEILLKDDSIFQFSLTRYAFIQNPNISVTKEDLLSRMYSQDELANLSEGDYNEMLDSVDDLTIEQFKNEQNINVHAHVIRYDIDERGYKPLQHAYSHFHIGNNNNIRIPCARILTPLAFVLFVLKHTYSMNQPMYEELLPVDKGNKVPIQYWHDEEQYELYFT